MADKDGDGVPDELESIEVFFNPTRNKMEAETRFVPRAILVDLEPGTLDVIKASSCGALYKPDNMIFGSNGAGSTFFFSISLFLVAKYNNSK